MEHWHGLIAYEIKLLDGVVKSEMKQFKELLEQ